jgi:hypothetical protein
MTLDGIVWLTSLSVRFIPVHKPSIPIYYEAVCVQGRFGRFGKVQRNLILPRMEGVLITL